MARAKKDNTEVDVLEPAASENGQETTAHEATEQAAELIVTEVRESTVTLHREEVAASALANELAGKMKQAELVETASKLSVLYDLQRIKSEKLYKGAYIKHVDTGEYVTTKTWEDYCEALGKSRKIIDEDLNNLATFGGNLIRIQDELGIGYRELRKMRAGLLELTPEEQQQALIRLTGAEDKEEVLGMVDELQVKLATAEKKAAELEESLTESEAFREKAANARDKAELKLDKIIKIQESDPEKLRLEREKDARKSLTEAVNIAIGETGAVAAFANAIFAEATPDFAEFVNAQIGVMCQTIRNQLLQAGVDVDFAAYMACADDTEGEDAAVAPENA